MRSPVGGRCRRSPRSRTDGAVPRSRSRWAQLTARYPADWIDQGAPVVAWSRYSREAHAPPHAERPRYELRITRPSVDRGRRDADQGALF
ncbi:DUF6349 family protein [Streptomyces sp. AJS327]|uniref:DUF6349 family protein n=1 Tax=Streptomyces sp. AJS327 TaxID=2545265 RepID=UPI0035B50E6A